MNKIIQDLAEISQSEIESMDFSALPDEELALAESATHILKYRMLLEKRKRLLEMSS